MAKKKPVSESKDAATSSNKKKKSKSNKKTTNANDNTTMTYVSAGFAVWILVIAIVAAIYRPSFLSQDLTIATAPTSTPPTAVADGDDVIGPPKTSPPDPPPPRNLEDPVKDDTSNDPENATVESIPKDVILPEYTCNGATLENYVHDVGVRVPGMHVLCVSSANEDNPDHKNLHIYQYATKRRSNIAKQNSDTSASQLDEFIPSHKVRMEAWNWDTLRTTLESVLKLPDMDDGITKQPWAIFDPTGERLIAEDWEVVKDSEESELEDDVLDPEDVVQRVIPKLGMAILLEGGQWFWPGIEKGYKRTIALDQSINVTLETLSLTPLVLSVEGFLTEEECDYIQARAEPSMQYSSVTLMDKDKDKASSDFRTSQSTFLSSSKSPELQLIDDKTAQLVRLPISHQEHAQVLRYEYDEKYDSHLDYFDPSLYQQDARTMNTIKKGRRNRMITVFWYLTDVQEGGETVFPRADGAPHPHSMNVHSGGCDEGLKVQPKRGKVIIFYSMMPDGAMDPHSLHGACPVKEGVKWAANKWVWNEPMTYISRRR